MQIYRASLVQSVKLIDLLLRAGQFNRAEEMLNVCPNKIKLKNTACSFYFFRKPLLFPRPFSPQSKILPRFVVPARNVTVGRRQNIPPKHRTERHGAEVHRGFTPTALNAVVAKLGSSDPHGSPMVLCGMGGVL